MYLCLEISLDRHCIPDCCGLRQYLYPRPSVPLVTTWNDLTTTTFIIASATRLRLAVICFGWTLPLRCHSSGFPGQLARPFNLDCPLYYIRVASVTQLEHACLNTRSTHSSKQWHLRHAPGHSSSPRSTCLLLSDPRPDIHTISSKLPLRRQTRLNTPPILLTRPHLACRGLHFSALTLPDSCADSASSVSARRSSPNPFTISSRARTRSSPSVLKQLTCCCTICPRPVVFVL